MAKATPSTLLVKLSGFKTPVMTNPSMLGGTSYHLLRWVCHPSPLQDKSHVYEPTDLDKFPHVLLTGPHEWDPSC